LGEGRIRRPGAGRKLITVADPRLVDTLEEMIDHQTRGDPESALRWICKSTRAIAKELDRNKHPVSHAKGAQLLHDLNYSLQSNRKTEEGRDHPDRDAQFRYINAAVKRCLAQGSPVIAIRYADDSILGFQHQTDADRFLENLRERLGKFGLELHPDKTRRIEFGPEKLCRVAALATSGARRPQTRLMPY
jgi:hypothetical protein